MKSLPLVIATLSLAASIGGCRSTDAVTETPMETTHRMRTGGSIDGRPVNLFTLRNANGMEVEVMDHGATVTRVIVPDRDGNPVDVVLGFDTAEEYPEKSQYFGCTVGRVGNRIAGGRFELDGKAYALAANNGPNHLHGGEVGFDKRRWDADPIMTAKGPGVRFTLTSADGEEGYPGRVEAETIYVLTDRNELEVEMSATTDAPTPVNIVHHTYWNLGGHDSGTILDEVLRIRADRYTPVDGTFIPTGDLAPVAGTAVDFRTAKRIGRDIDAYPGDQAEGGEDPGGYDHNFCLDGEAGTMREVVRLSDPRTGIVMTITTDQPGIQFYTGNFLNGMTGKGGAVYEKFGGLCLETQAYPDSINHAGEPGWPDVVLRPGDTYRHRMVHRFGID